MTTETASWNPSVVEKVQGILDHSASTATPVVGGTFANEDRRLDAESFLSLWNSVRMCTVASASPTGAPHIAVIHAAFTPEGRLTMRMFEGSVRQKDFQANPKVALSKYADDGSVMMVYGKPVDVAGSYAPPRGGGPGAGTIEVEIDVTRIYAMCPRPRA